MKESLYLETSVISYFSSRPSRDIIVLAHQEITRLWWPNAIKKFDIFVSEIVIKEASMGDQEAAKRRLDDLKKFHILNLTSTPKFWIALIILGLMHFSINLWALHLCPHSFS